MWYSNIFNINLTGQNNMSKKRLAKMENSLTQRNNFARLSQIGINRGTIKNLPDTVSERTVLQSLFWYGSVCFFEKEGNLLAFPGVPTGALNANGDPGEVRVFSTTGVLNEKVKVYLPGGDKSSFLRKTIQGIQQGETTGVFVRANALCYPLVNECIYYTERISDTMRTLDVVRQHLKIPFIIQCDQEEVKSILKQFEDRNDNMPLIIATKIYQNANRADITPIEITSSIIDSTIELLEFYENRWKALNGIKNNEQIDKKGENLIQDEIQVSDEMNYLTLKNMSDYVNEGLEYVNEFYGTNMTFEPRGKEEMDNENEDVFGDSSDDSRPVSDAD